ncbi:MAG: hypothetical protein DHS20C17_25970 [Cyclobacteriaceae bacterium]|nr:MAG: hypothetical protein DHS20C17_25970 [Cyclobacteriaceae bacterium]
MLIAERKPEWEYHVGQYVCQHQSRFNQLIDYFYSGDALLSHRAALIILTANDLKPQWVEKQVPKLIKSLSPDTPVWFRRSILRILQYQQIPESLWGHAADQCFNYLSSGDQSVAVKVFSMTVLYNLTRRIPDLARELRLTIEAQYELGSAGYKARARKILKELARDGH